MGDTLVIERYGPGQAVRRGVEESMAMVGEFREVTAERDAMHDRVECGWRSFTVDGREILQLDTYGRPGRKLEGKVSQSVQLDRDGARDLLAIIRRSFPGLRDE